jgi:ATP-dependent Clp protease ATP-binding subunit ClpC
MAGQRSHDDLSPICRHAESLAARRKERLSSVHLLLAIAAHPTVAGTLLDAHRLTAARIEASIRGAEEEDESLVRALVKEARDIAARTGGKDASSPHVLLALLGERKCAAHSLIERSGADAGRLRMATLQIAIGATAPPRLAAQTNGPTPSSPAPRSPRATQGHAVAIPVVPKPRSAGSTPPPAHPPSSSRIVVPAARAAAPPPSAARSAVARPSLREAPPRESAASAIRPVKRVDERLVLDSKRFPVLSAFGKNLSLAAARGELAPVIGRSDEVERCLDVLAKRHANNPVLVGPPGVGKSSIIRGVAFATAEAEPATSDDRVVVELTMTALVSGASVRGVLAERFGSIQKELACAERRVILVLEDIHLFFSGAADDEIGAELRGALARGEIPCIGTALPEDHRRVIEQDSTLFRLFTPLVVEELDRDDAILVLSSVAESLSRHHDVLYPDEALASALGWTVRYMPGRALPDKAISVLDLAGARAHRRRATSVSAEVIASVVSELTEVPEERMLETDADRMLALEATLAESVVGHGDMLARIATILRRNAAGIRGKRPIGTFLLLGPTGVGKTETAKAIAAALFSSPDAMTRLDLSEYAEAHSIARMIGAPPGYIGHEAGGQLTESVRRRPYQVVLLDEIEKAHRDVLQGFLQVFDEGRLTDGRGRTVDFSNTVLVMTSNLGASSAVVTQSKGIGFRSADRASSEPRTDHEAVVAAAREALPPELYNRIDEVLVFAALSRDDVQEIARHMLSDLASTLLEGRGIDVVFDDDVPLRLVEKGGYDPELGARPMRRAIAKHVEGPLADLVLRGRLTSGDVARVRVRSGEIVVEAERRRAEPLSVA